MCVRYMLAHDSCAGTDSRKDKSCNINTLRVNEPDGFLVPAAGVCDKKYCLTLPCGIIIELLPILL